MVCAVRGISSDRLSILRVIGLFGSAFCISACAFFLDFDDLQSNADDAGIGTGGASGASGTGGSSGGDAGGTGGSSGACGNCDDGDSCTDDTCDETVSPPACKRTPKVGVVDDGFSATLPSDTVHRVTLVAGTNAFYLAAFATDGGVNRGALYEVGLQGTTLQQRFDVSTIGSIQGREIRSTAGLVADTSAGLQIHAFIAFASADSSVGSDVYHVIISGGDFSVLGAEMLASTYDASNQRRYPVAAQVATGDVRGAWINADNTISAGALGKPLVTFGDATHRASQLTALTSPTQFAVLYTGPDGVFTQLEGGTPNPVTECELRVGAFMSAASAWSQIPGLWFAVWTKVGTGFLSTEYKGVVCGAAQCNTTAGCEGDQRTDLLRNPVSVMAKRTGDPPGVVYQASAAPFLAPNAGNTGADAVLLLVLSRIDFGATPLQTPAQATDLGTVELARMPAQTDALRGPDWPAVALLNDRVTVAWIEPGAGGRDDLEVRRLRMCLPQ